MSSSPIRVAVSQHEPAWLDLEASVKKTIAIVEEAAKGDAKLVAFPEVWIPGYPAWIWSRPVDFDLASRYVKNSLQIDSEEIERIKSAAKANNIAVVLGFSENNGNDSLYISQALISATGELEMKRRKFKPTHMERTIFGDASGDCLHNVVNLPEIGNVGALSCWEHIQPLLKYNTFLQKEQIHVAAWPPLDPFIEGSPGFWSMSEEGCRGLSQTYAVEAQAYVLHSTTLITSAGTEIMGTGGSPLMGMKNKGDSAVFGPDGRCLTKPIEGEGLVYADLDLGQVTKAKTFADATGHYSRPDMLWLGADWREKGLIEGKLPKKNGKNEEKLASSKEAANGETKE